MHCMYICTLLPLHYSFDNRGHMTSFKLLLSTREEQVLDALKKTYPTTKAAEAALLICVLRLSSI